MPYVSLTEARTLAWGMSENAVPPAGDALVKSLIERASRMVDRECGVVEGYFEEADPDADATERTFYPEGLNYLKLDPYVPGTLSALTVPAGYTTPDYVQSNGYLIRTGSDHVLPAIGWVWNAGVPVTVTAKWGFEATPADIKHAVLELAINLWRESDPATAKLVGLDGLILRESLPPRVREIVKFRRLSEAKAVFV